MKKVLKIISFVVLIIIIGCSSTRPTGKTEAEVLYKEAKDLIKDGRYILANEKLNSIRSQYPYSYYSTHAELLQADILFEQENYVESSAAYILFKDLHPKNSKLDYVIWKIAESFYNQLPSTFDRDLTSGQEAIYYYRSLLRRFPHSKYIKGAKEKIKTCSDMLLKKEKYIADFYFKTGVYDSALYRYLDMIESFNSVELLDHSMLRVLECSLNLKKYSQCIEYYKTYKAKISNKNLDDLTNFYNDCSQQYAKEIPSEPKVKE